MSLLSKGERVLGGWCILAAPKDMAKPTDDDYMTFDISSKSCIYYLIRKYHKTRNDLDLDQTNYQKDDDDTVDDDDSSTDVEATTVN